MPVIHRGLWVIFSVCLAGGVAASPYTARAKLDGDLCAQGTGVVDMDILVCTRAIRAGGFQDVSLATLHNALGSAFRKKARPDKAIDQHDKAIELNPSSAVAFHDRGLAWLAQGALGRSAQDMNQALALFPGFADAVRARGRIAFLRGNDRAAIGYLDKAVWLQPANSEAFAFRGFAYFRSGAFERAAEDFSNAAKTNLDYPYLEIWRYLSLTRLGGSATRQATGVLFESLKDLEPGQWPFVLVAVLAGRASESALMQELSKMHRALAPRRGYEARFYLAMHALVMGTVPKAEAHFRALIKVAPELSVEHVLARHELQRIHP